MCCNPWCLWADTEEELNAKLDAALSHLEDIRLGLNYENHFLKMTQMPYMGDIITKEGVKPGPWKLQTIRDIAAPSDVTELQRDSGLTKYKGKFIPNLSAWTWVLRALLIQNAEWQLKSRHEAVNVKALLMAEPGPWFNINMSSYQYRKSHCGDKTVERWSYISPQWDFLYW